MDRELGEKHVVVMASFTVAAVVVASAYGFKRLLKRGNKPLVSSTSMENPVDYEERQIEENEFADTLTKINEDEDNDVDPSTTISLPISSHPETEIDDNPMNKAKDNHEIEMEKLNISLKELHEELAKLGSQQSDINELKKKMKVDEEKIDKLLWQEDEINKLKLKLKEDQNQIREMQKELIMLREKQNKKKGNWFNRTAVVHDVAVSELSSSKSKKLQSK